MNKDLRKKALMILNTASHAVSTSGRILGTYVHGFFDDDIFRWSFIQAARAAVGLAAAAQFVEVTNHREARIDRLAAELRSSLNIIKISSWIVEPGNPCAGNHSTFSRAGIPWRRKSF